MSFYGPTVPPLPRRHKEHSGLLRGSTEGTQEPPQPARSAKARLHGARHFIPVLPLLCLDQATSHPSTLVYPSLKWKYHHSCSLQAIGCVRMKAPVKTSTVLAIMKESNTGIKSKKPSEDHKGEYFFSRAGDEGRSKYQTRNCY